MTNSNNTVLHVEVTSDLHERVADHKSKRYQDSFSARYNLSKLVYFEAFQMIGDAIGREKQMKGGSRKKKVDLIRSMNPEWNDLTFSINDFL
ncbi:GIY-YIG nuclease family protein [Flavobacterium album]